MNEGNIIVLGRELHIMRKQTGLCQAGMARRLGISQGAISCYERGSTRIPAHVSRTVYAHLCDQPSALEDNAYAKMQEACAKAFEEAARAEEQLVAFWEEHIVKDWSGCSDHDEGGIAEGIQGA